MCFSVRVICGTAFTGTAFMAGMAAFLGGTAALPGGAAAFLATATFAGAAAILAAGAGFLAGGITISWEKHAGRQQPAREAPIRTTTIGVSCAQFKIAAITGIFPPGQ